MPAKMNMVFKITTMPDGNVRSITPVPIIKNESTSHRSFKSMFINVQNVKSGCRSCGK